MTDIDDINDAIADNAVGPASVTVAGQSVTAKTADDLIKAATHVAAQNSASKPHLGLRFTQLVPPGTG